MNPFLEDPPEGTRQHTEERGGSPTVLYFRAFDWDQADRITNEGFGAEDEGYAGPWWSPLDSEETVWVTRHPYRLSAADVSVLVELTVGFSLADLDRYACRNEAALSGPLQDYGIPSDVLNDHTTSARPLSDDEAEALRARRVLAPNPVS